MLIKEYRILLPLSTDEYKIAQLYMIQKKSRLDSSGSGHGVEIITNKPYDIEGDNAIGGQYTYKIYHVGSRIPVWIRSVLPSTALQAHEEAWNAYPYTKTRYTCPLIERCSIDVETKYFDDAGTQNNVFHLSDEELETRIIDVMDFVKDTISASDYSREEDPRLYKSLMTGRGPLSDNWVQEFVASGRPVMCAYKLCRVEFRYWGMQTRAERWIHDLALKGTMLRAHRQAWAWQDEWHGLTMADIRRLEHDAALHLSRVMAQSREEHVENENNSEASSDEVYFDASDSVVPNRRLKPALIRWSSELLIGDGDSPPLSPRPDASSSLLILLFHGDISDHEGQPEGKLTDVSTLKSTLETVLSASYRHLNKKVMVLPVCCGQELTPVAVSVRCLKDSFGAHSPSLALLLASCPRFDEALHSAIHRANQVLKDFLVSDMGIGFSGDFFVVGDSLGGLLLYEILARNNGEQALSVALSRHSSSVSTHSQLPPDDDEVREIDPSTALWMDGTMETVDRPASLRNLSAPRSSGNRQSKEKEKETGLILKPTVAFLIGCPLALVLAQKKMNGREPVSKLDCGQLYNIYYELDRCGCRLEPVLNEHLSTIKPVILPRFQRFPTGDGHHSVLHGDSTMDSALPWGPCRIDHALYCPQAMASLPFAALPDILHASYWENSDVAAFILRQFLRCDHIAPMTTTSSALPLQMELPVGWSRRRTRFKVANLSPNHRANDVIIVEDSGEQCLQARFCYGPMDLVALTRESISLLLCVSGEWKHHSEHCTDGHGRLMVNLGQTLPLGIHAIKMVVHGDHSYLDMFMAIVPARTSCVVFSIDGSLTGSVSVTGRDPRLRPGAVDVVRAWQDLGYLIIYVTARPDMQQRVVVSWLAQHNFPHALLFFTPLSTDPLRQKATMLRHLLEKGLQVQAAYGSSKDVQIYSTAGISPDRIFSVSGRVRRGGCIVLDGGYATHLAQLSAGKVELAQPVAESRFALGKAFFSQRGMIQRAHSFTPRSGKYETRDKR